MLKGNKKILYRQTKVGIFGIFLDIKLIFLFYVSKNY